MPDEVFVDEVNFWDVSKGEDHLHHNDTGET